MKPCHHRAARSSDILVDNIHRFTEQKVIAMVYGTTRKLGQQYKDAIVALYNKANLQLIAVRKPDQNGNYQFAGLNTDLKTFIVAFDKNQQFNAVIQDNVVPK